MIVFENVNKTYPRGREALAHINVHIERGQMVFLTGHSGAGKSTFLKLISLIERPTRGRVLINQDDTRKIPNHGIALFRHQIGMVFQDHQLLNEHTVFDNVALPLVVQGYRHRVIERRVNDCLEAFELAQYQRSYPSELSGGEQQRVGIARAVVRRPKILLADEPTGNLDPELSANMMKRFADYNHHNQTTIVIASHNINLINSLNYPVIQLKEGKVIQS